MSLALSEVILPTFMGGLGSLKHCLEMAAAHAEEKKIKPSALIDARLFPNMFGFGRQIQVACDAARRGSDRLAGDDPSSVEDNETTFDELIARIDATVAHIEKLDRAAIDASEDRSFSIQYDRPVEFTGRSYVMTFAIPNFMFHVTTAYDILRHNGVELGKRGFLVPFAAANGGSVPGH